MYEMEKIFNLGSRVYSYKDKEDLLNLIEKDKILGFSLYDYFQIFYNVNKKDIVNFVN